MKGFAPTYCGLDYGRDVVLRASPFNSIGVMDNEARRMVQGATLKAKGEQISLGNHATPPH
jgi:hypothetical protein